METVFLVILAILDVILLGVVYVLGRRQIQPVAILKDLTEERRLLRELRLTVKEELEDTHGRVKSILGQVTAIAADVEMEVKSGRDTLTREMEEVLAEFSKRLEGMVGQVGKKQAALSKLLRMVEQEKESLVKAVSRGEKLARFFNNHLPYEQVLEEIEDKKYMDARALLSKGMVPADVAKELNLPEAEVKLIAAVR